MARSKEMLLRVAIWVVIGLAVGEAARRRDGTSFPLARSATLIGAAAGAFLGGGAVATLSWSGVWGEGASAAMAVVGAGVLVAAVRWAGHANGGYGSPE
jgi:hypothetical protein